MDWLRDTWHDVTTPSPLPSQAVVLTAVGIAALLLVVPPLWHLSRHALTIVHEAGHAGVALLVGRRVSGIKVHSDTSGLTLSRGRARGPGMVATAFAGYPAPALVGLVADRLLRHGYDLAVLWGLLVLALLVLLAIRNWYGLWSVLVALAVVASVTLWAPPGLRFGFASCLTWFFLLGAPRAVLEMQLQRRAVRRRGRPDTSDAALLGSLTRTPGGLWVVLLGLVTLVPFVV